MADAALLRTGGRLRWVGAHGGMLAEAPVEPEPEEAAARVDAGEPISEALRGWIQARAPRGSLAVLEPALAPTIAPLERGPVPISETEARHLRAEGWPALEPWDRRFYLALMQRRLAARLSSPEEALISLAREEERTERAVEREGSAARSFVTGTSEPLRRHAERWRQFRGSAQEHHRELRAQLEEAAGSLAPNLAQVVGPLVAARLIARAGGIEALGRMSASRAQLLGSRRRPAGGHGPRYGVMFRAEGMEQVPPDRRGAYARSLAALAVIAARADGSGRRRISPALRLRRDRRISSLSRQRRAAE
ncbi:MAG TPA: hypothetical protein VGU43_06275 [Thermoplasmata archaeon]|nr:hypothetical protein [Thermoplasmata archaeon]